MADPDRYAGAEAEPEVELKHAKTAVLEVYCKRSYQEQDDAHGECHVEAIVADVVVSALVAQPKDSADGLGDKND